jgi:hypothetical protein
MTEIVVSTLREFRDERRSRRRAYLACIAVFHLKDHLKKAGETGIENAMRGACGTAFDVVRRRQPCDSVPRRRRQRSAACGLGRGNVGCVALG